MNFGRILLAGIVGGAAMFIWGAFDHKVLPTGEMGIQDLPAETTLVPQLKEKIPVRGAYRIPGMKPKDTSEGSQKAIEEKYKSGPIGMLIYDPAGGSAIQ